MLIFTDGGDNGSKTDLDKLADSLAKAGLSNLNVVRQQAPLVLSPNISIRLPAVACSSH